MDSNNSTQPKHSLYHRITERDKAVKNLDGCRVADKHIFLET